MWSEIGSGGVERDRERVGVLSKIAREWVWSDIASGGGGGGGGGARE